MRNIMGNEIGTLSLIQKTNPASQHYSRFKTEINQNNALRPNGLADRSPLGSRSRIGACFEKRDWGGGRRTWRRVPPLLQRYGKRTSGPSEYAIRLISGRAAAYAEWRR